MSEYQYYEFRAIDRALDAREQDALRDISSRASISAHHFQNHYDYGNLRADPVDLLARYFDVFLYLANWGDRQFAMRLPKRLVDVAAIRRCADEEVIHVSDAGDSLIVHLSPEGLEAPDWIEAEGLLDTFAPVRAEVLDGDLRFATLAWLMNLEGNDLVEDDAEEPQPSLAGMSDALRSLAAFFGIDPDLVEAAAAGPPDATAGVAPAEVRAWLERLPEAEKVDLLHQLHDGVDPLLGAGLRLRVRRALSSAPRTVKRRTAGELRAAMRVVADERLRAALEAKEKARERVAKERARAQLARVGTLRSRGERAWDDVEDLIGQRSASSYDKATEMLGDLALLAQMDQAVAAFDRRLDRLRTSHGTKRKFIERLDAVGLGGRAERLP